MPSTSCERVTRDLARLEAEIDRLDVAAVISGLIRFIDGVLHPAYASVLLCDPDATACDAWGVAPDHAVQREPGTQWAKVMAAMPEGGLVYCRDRSEGCALPDAFLYGWPASVRSFLVVPLKTGQSLIGTFNVGSAAADGFSADELALLDAAAPRVAGALKVAQLLEHNRQRLSTCDSERSELRRRVGNSDERGDAGGRPEAVWGAIIGRSAALGRVVDRIERVAPTDAGVLILGESGTGKELVADEIHRRSLRRSRPLVKVNCASIPRELYESEFFGHVKGAFTGAINDRVGRFEAADGGTLFLDEVGEIPLGAAGQAAARAAERRVRARGRRAHANGGRADHRRHQRACGDEIAAGRFREDLYYRLNVFPIELPPLRERQEDIPPLAAHIAAAASGRLNRAAPRLTEEDLRSLQAYGWPGNVRELQNMIERALILSGDGPLIFELPGSDTVDRPRPAVQEDASPTTEAVMTETEVLELQRRNLTAALARCRWTIYGETGAAKLLGIKPTTLIERMRRMGIRRPH